ncbi:MAG: (Fe-S)-binding protein [Nitrososphaeria archaeon]
MHFIHDLNIKMPSENCGLCGSLTCRMATLAIYRGRMDPTDCPFLVNERKDALDEIYRLIEEGISPDLSESKVGFESISPCPSDPSKLMFVYYPERVENLVINLYDEKLMGVLLDNQVFFTSRSSPELGFSRIENDKGEYVIVFARGKFIARQALSESSGRKFLQCAINLLWLSKTSCEIGYTILDGVQGICDCKMTTSSIERGPENISLQEKGFVAPSSEESSGFFDRLVKSISENLTSNNANRYLQICRLSLREHSRQLALANNKENAKMNARLLSKWIALHEILRTTSTYAGKDTLKISSQVLKHLVNQNISSVEHLLSESRGHSWPKNFIISRICANAKRYLSVQL